MGMFKTPSVGTSVGGRVIAEVGTLVEFGIKNYLLPALMKDETYTVLVWSDGEYPEGPRSWEPDDVKAANAIAHSVRMPVARRGIGSDVIHVQGVDQEGSYTAKLFYNEKKHTHGRQDELHR